MVIKSINELLKKKRNPIKFWQDKGAIIGENCEIYSSASLGSEPYLIKIGNHVRINGGVQLITHDGGCWTLRGLKEEYKNYDLFDQVSNEEYKFCRVFLISDNFERNLRELLHFLQVIKDNQKQVENGQFEFFIRGEEEKIAPFVDTALARLENLIIPVRTG